MLKQMAYLNDSDRDLRTVECLHELMVSRDTEKDKSIYLQAWMYKSLGYIVEINKMKQNR